MFRELMNQNSAQDWLIAVGAIAVWMLLFHAARKLLLRRFTPMAAASATHFDDFIVDVLSATRFLLAAAIGIYIAGHYLDLPERMALGLDRIFIALMLLQGGMWAERGMQFWLKGRFSPSSGDSAPDAGSMLMTRALLMFIGKVLLWSVVLLMIMDNMGLDVTALIASLGIGGIAVALAVQNILGDVFASLSITVDKPFVIGDFIIVGDFMGTVEHVGLKTTRLRSLSGEQLIFSNNDLLGSRIRNYKRMNERRAVFNFGVAYGTPADKVAMVAKFTREIIEAEKNVRFDRAHFKGFGPSSLDFEAVYIMLDPDFNLYMDVQERINLALMKRLAEHEIEFSLPVQKVQVLGEALRPLRSSPQPLHDSSRDGSRDEAQDGGRVISRDELRDTTSDAQSNGQRETMQPPRLIMPTGR